MTRIRWIRLILVLGVVLAVAPACTPFIVEGARKPASEGITLNDDETLGFLWQSEGVLEKKIIKGNQESFVITGNCDETIAAVKVRVNDVELGDLPCLMGKFATQLDGFQDLGEPELYTLEFSDATSGAANPITVSVEYEFLKLEDSEMLWDLNTGPLTGVTETSATLEAKCRQGVEIVLNDEEFNCPVDGEISEFLDLPNFGVAQPNEFTLIWKDAYGNGNADSPYQFSIYRNAPGAPHIIGDQGGALSPAAMPSFVGPARIEASPATVSLESPMGLTTGVGTHNNPPLSVQDTGTGITVTIGR